MLRPSPIFCRAMRDANRREVDPKTMTRRVAKTMPSHWSVPPARICGGRLCRFGASEESIALPHGQPGDVWYMREPLRPSQSGIILYADDGETVWRDGAETAQWPWKRNILPALFMPVWTARMFKFVTDVRVGRLWDITEADAIAEGVTVSLADRNIVALYAECRPDLLCPAASQWAFHALWDSLNAKRGHPWSANDFVYVYSYKTATPAEVEAARKE